MTAKTIAYTIFENAKRNRVWVFWFDSRPEFVPGYWDLETKGLDNPEGHEWCQKMNDFVELLEQAGTSRENIETTIRYTMVDGLGFSIIEDFDPKYAAA